MCTSWVHREHLCSSRCFWVFKRCSESVWKVHKRHACSTQKMSSRYQAVNHCPWLFFMDYLPWTSAISGWLVLIDHAPFCPDHPHDWQGRRSAVSAMLLIQWKQSYRGLNSWQRQREGQFSVSLSEHLCRLTNCPSHFINSSHWHRCTNQINTSCPPFKNRRPNDRWHA